MNLLRNKPKRPATQQRREPSSLFFLKKYGELCPRKIMYTLYVKFLKILTQHYFRLVSRIPTIFYNCLLGI